MADEKLYRIGEVATLLNLKTSVLRFWESEFPELQPQRSAKGHRSYREKDVAVLRRIKQLLHEQGMTIEGARKVHDFLTVGAAAPLQEAAVAGLEMPASYYEELQALYTEKRDHFLAGLDRVGLKHNVPQGTYFVMIDISDFLALPQFKGWTDLQFCEWMIREVGVAAVPGSSFFREPVNHLIRMHFARGTDVLDEAVRRLEKLQALLK